MEIYLVFEKMRRGFDNHGSFAGAYGILPEYFRNFFLKASLFSYSVCYSFLTISCSAVWVGSSISIL